MANLSKEGIALTIQRLEKDLLMRLNEIRKETFFHR
jgi:hypothetical protein